MVARFGDEVTVKRYVQIDERHVELRPESHNAAHEVMKLDLAMHILQIEGIVVGALIRGLDDRRIGHPAQEQSRVNLAKPPADRARTARSRPTTTQPRSAGHRNVRQHAGRDVGEPPNSAAAARRTPTNLPGTATRRWRQATETAPE